MNENVKFLSSNLILATDTLAASSGDDTLQYIIDRKNTTEWASSGSSEGVAATITWTPDAPISISRIILKGINWKIFTIKYNTTSDFNPVLSYTVNADEDLVIEVDLQQVTNIVFSCSNTIGAVAEKICSQIVICTEHFECAYNTNEYAPEIGDPAGAIMEMLDGGAKRAYVRDIFEIDLEWDFVEDSEYVNFKALYDLKASFIFVPEPLASAWDGKFYDVNIIDAWFGEKYSKGYRLDGRNIVIRLKETGL